MSEAIFISMELMGGGGSGFDPDVHIHHQVNGTAGHSNYSMIVHYKCIF